MCGYTTVCTYPNVKWDESQWIVCKFYSHDGKYHHRVGMNGTSIKLISIGI